MDILLPIIIIFSIMIVIMYIKTPCEYSYRSKTGKNYRTRDGKTAELLDVLRLISNDLAKRIDQEDSEILLSRVSTSNC